MTGDSLIAAYREAAHDYEAAKAGIGNRAAAFIQFLVAERALAASLGRVNQKLEVYQERSLSW
jgi:hypothetical protein